MLLIAMLPQSVWNSEPPRLEGQHAARRPDFLGEEQRMRADVGTDVDHNLACRQDLVEDDDCPFAVFAVQLQRPADTHDRSCYKRACRNAFA